MSLRPLMASSIFWVTRVSTASGPAPGYAVTIVTTGVLIVGNSATPSRVQASRPKASTAPAASNTSSGRRTARIVKNMSLSALLRIRGELRHRGLVGQARCDHIAGVERGYVAGGDERTLLDAAHDLDKVIRAQPNADRLDVHNVAAVDSQDLWLRSIIQDR